jgi:hypothetical protein
VAVAFTEKIRLLFEADDKGSFGRLKRDIADADGAAGKMKAGLGGLGQMLKANLAEAAMAAGTAVVALGVKSVEAFQDAALGAGKFSDATGIAVDDASRWIEVAGDLGIEADTIQGAFMRLNKAIADGKPSLEQFGVEVVRTSDGLIDADATMQNALTTIGEIPDASERAKAAQELFGRSYGEVAELMEMDAEDLADALASVSDEQVIDADEERKAKRFRDAMDGLGDAADRLQKTIGEYLVPHLTELAETATDVIESDFLEWVDKTSKAVDKFTLDITDIVDKFQQLDDALRIITGNELVAYGEALDKNAVATRDLGDDTQDLGDDFADLDKQAYLAEKALDDAKDASNELGTAYDRLMGKLDEREAYANAQEAVGDLMETMANAESSWGDLSAAADDATRAYADFVMGTDKVPDEVKTLLIAELDAGNLDKVRAFIDAVMKGFDMPIYPKLVGGAGVSGATGGQLPSLPKFDSGGVMPGPKGEHNLALVAGGETILPTHKPGALPMGGITINANITTTSDPRGVYESFMRGLRLYGAADLKRQLGL